MNRRRDYPAVLSVVGLIVVLGIIGGLDALMAFLRHRNLETFTPVSVIFWSQTLIALLLAALLLLLSWFVLQRARRNAWIAALYLLIGSFLVLSPQLYFTPALSYWIPEFVFASVILPGSYLFVAGGFVAMIGLFSLVLPSRERMVSQH